LGQNRKPYLQSVVRDQYHGDPLSAPAGYALIRRQSDGWIWFPRRRQSRCDPHLPFGGGALLVGINLDQAGIASKALAAHQAIREAPRNGFLKQMAQQFAFLKATMSVLGDL
jgi:hypothetical protein